MQMCAADKDLKREHAVDAVLLSTRTQHQLRLDVQLDLEGGGWKWVCAQTCDCAIVLLNDFFFFFFASLRRWRKVSNGTRSHGVRE